LSMSLSVAFCRHTQMPGARRRVYYGSRSHSACRSHRAYRDRDARARRAVLTYKRNGAPHAKKRPARQVDKLAGRPPDCFKLSVRAQNRSPRHEGRPRASEEHTLRWRASHLCRIIADVGSLSVRILTDERNRSARLWSKVPGRASRTSSRWRREHFRLASVVRTRSRGIFLRQAGNRSDNITERIQNPNLTMQAAF
jgi:hypothetical protein